MALRRSTGLRNKMLHDNDVLSLFANGTIRVYSGAQPSSPDGAESGDLLLEITQSSSPFTPGSTHNGINFGSPAVAGVLSKDAGEVWSGTGEATGTAGWFRHYDNDATTGSSTTAVRLDGNISTSGAELNMSSTSIATGATDTIDTYSITLPES